ncbi:heavy metal-responsive transcriptional regulator [Pseudothauera nasutitermitis]|uniref:Heavy metal-responsive transcriptional regulator n=1 Tax=Pseudothauera nasutitermitis TaxID=2565930 RepID=A0A4S4B3K1_9RHOO|nr:heavy metal-responsive transcriptional regulator [Pseudothauera nasutitermitis]THF67257.1 heavy metal-responsive transcriptional regulator [Pseudothauera nasutitermitis]
MSLNTSPSRVLTIGALARECGVPVDTLRHWEREGLLEPLRRASSGYRQYDRGSADRVRFIQSAKTLGFTLVEIAELLDFSTDAEHGVQGVKDRASRRLAEIERQIGQLVAIRDRLSRLVEACPGSGSPDCCPILTGIREEAAAEPRACCAKPPAT